MRAELPVCVRGFAKLLLEAPELKGKRRRPLSSACPVVRNQNPESQPVPEPARVSVSLREVCGPRRPQLGQWSGLWTERWHWCQRPEQKEEGDGVHRGSSALSVVESRQLVQ